MTTAGQTPSPMRQPLLATFVVGVDSSPESLYALEQAALIGASHGATLRVVHVHPHPGALGFSPMASAEFERSQDQLDEMVKAEAAARLRSYIGSWSFVTRHGHPGEQLLNEAEDVDADLIVVGHRSHGVLRDALMGSVASSVVHHSRRSILIAIPPRPGA